MVAYCKIHSTQRNFPGEIKLPKMYAPLKICCHSCPVVTSSKTAEHHAEIEEQEASLYV
jgi:hypothetical protein